MLYDNANDVFTQNNLTPTNLAAYFEEPDRALELLNPPQILFSLSVSDFLFFLAPKQQSMGGLGLESIMPSSAELLAELSDAKDTIAA